MNGGYYNTNKTGTNVNNDINGFGVVVMVIVGQW